MKRGRIERDVPPRPRRTGELARMAAPVLGGLGALLRLYHWPILCLFVLYLASGFAVVKPDEVAMILRFGRLVGSSPGEQVHGPGFLFALPRPIDEVVRVNVQKVHAVRIYDLTYGLGEGGGPRTFAQRDTIDPEKDGYCLTGDRNVLQAQIVARYRIADPVAYALRQTDPAALLRDAVLSAAVQSAGEMGIEDVMSEDRKLLSAAVLRRAQAELDGTGVVLAAIELEQLEPPFQVLPAFRGVVSTMIDAYTQLQEALQYRETELPAAGADAARIRAEARGEAAERVARARGEAAAFRSLYAEYAREPALVRERLYREAIERALGAVEDMRFVAPPAGERYEGFRITIPF